MKKEHLIGIVFLLSQSCFGPDLTTVDFFQVFTNEPEFLDQLGKVKLKGRISMVGTTDITDYGFFWWESEDELTEAPEWANHMVGDAPIINDEFKKELPPLDLNKNYHYQAYARADGREVFGEIQHFTLQVSLNRNVIEVENSEATVTGGVTGLVTLSSAVIAHGHVWSADHPVPEVGDSDATNFEYRNNDGSIISQLENLQFNTTYYIRSYLQTDDTVYYSMPPDTFRVQDGWEMVSPFHTPIWDAMGASSGSEGYVGFGCPDKICLSTSLSREFWTFQPNDQWVPVMNLPPKQVLSRTKGVMFVIQGRLYVGLGEYHDGNQVIFHSDFWGYDPTSQQWTEVQQYFPGRARSGAVAFVVNHCAYIGTGEWSLAGDDYTYLNDFWEFNPAAEENQWRQVRNLPLKTGPESQEYADGRKGASAMVVNGEAFVGGGINLGLLLNDFWEFTPPSGLDTLGSWESHSFFPGKARFDAVAFSIAGKGYYGTGENFDNARYLKDFWEFDPRPGQPSWTEKTEFQGGQRARAVGFAIGEYGYLGTGEGRIFNNDQFSQVRYADFWRYTPER